MKTLEQINQVKPANNKGYGVETTFVLFFLAVEYGQTLESLALDSIFLAATLLMLIVLPYFISSGEKPAFGRWIFGRSLIAGFAVLLGAMFKLSLGSVLPEILRFLPMTLLIITAMLSCYVQFYSFFKLRAAK